nr:MAG TPA: hypothetical protein [Crassvirales sp.]
MRSQSSRSCYYLPRKGVNSHSTSSTLATSSRPITIPTTIPTSRHITILNSS